MRWCCDGLIDRLWLPLRTLGFLALLTWLLRRAGETWRGLGLHRPRPWWRATGVWLFGYLLIAVVGTLLIHVVLPALGWLVQATTAFTHLRGDFAEYFYWLIIAWTCAAIGEELAFLVFCWCGSSACSTADLDSHPHVGIAGPSHRVRVEPRISGAGRNVGERGDGLDPGRRVFGKRSQLVVCILLHGLVDTISLTVMFVGFEL